MGWFENVSEVQLRNIVDQLLKDKMQYVNMQERSLQIVKFNERLGTDVLVDFILDAIGEAKADD
jgi:hypothetical protein